MYLAKVFRVETWLKENCQVTYQKKGEIAGSARLDVLVIKDSLRFSNGVQILCLIRTISLGLNKKISAAAQYFVINKSILLQDTHNVFLLDQRGSWTNTAVWGVREIKQALDIKDPKS